MPPTKRARQLLVAVGGERDPPTAAAQVRVPHLLVEEDDVELMHARERLEALDELLLRGRQRRAFHAARAIEDVDEPRAFAFDAEHADARLAVAVVAVAAGAAGALSRLRWCKFRRVRVRHARWYDVLRRWRPARDRRNRRRKLGRV